MTAAPVFPIDLLPLALPVAVGAAVPFGLLLAVSFTPKAPAAVLAAVFMVVTVVATLGAIESSPASRLIGLVSVITVAACGLALVAAAAIPTTVPRRPGLIVAISIAIGVAGVVGFTLLDIPVRQIGIYQGIGPGNRDTYDLLLHLRNQGPLALSIVAAGLGGIAWRMTRRAPAATATLLGSIGIGVNVLSLLLQFGD